MVLYLYLYYQEKTKKYFIKSPKKIPVKIIRRDELEQIGFYIINDNQLDLAQELSIWASNKEPKKVIREFNKTFNN